MEKYCVENKIDEMRLFLLENDNKLILKEYIEPLKIASNHNDGEIFKMILENKTKSNKKVKEMKGVGISAILDNVCKKGNSNILEIVFENFSINDKILSNALSEACIYGYIDIIEMFFEKHFEKNIFVEGLKHAAYFNKIDVVRFFIEYVTKKDMKIPDNFFDGALIQAAHGNNFDIILLLVPMIKNFDYMGWGSTALEASFNFKDYKCFDFLIEYCSCNIQYKNRDNNNLAQLLFWDLDKIDHERYKKILLKTDCNRKNDKGFNIFYHLVKNKYYDLVKFVLDNKLMNENDEDLIKYYKYADKKMKNILKPYYNIDKDKDKLLRRSEFPSIGYYDAKNARYFR